MTVSPEYLQHMIRLATSARIYGSYAPYSKYRVGAALFVHPENSSTGDFYIGVNVENASYGLTICAERVAIFSAIAAYNNGIYTDEVFDTMVVLTKDGGTSCGACLQVMMEFNPDMDLIFVNEDGEVVSHAMVKELLPSSFTKENLEETKYYEIIWRQKNMGYPLDTVVGVTIDKESVLEEEPDAEFREITKKEWEEHLNG